MNEGPAPLSWEDTVKILRGLSGERVVLVGGQALNYWCERYVRRAPELDAERPFTSKDIDLQGTKREAQTLATHLHGELELPKPGAPTPISGLVTFSDSEGRERAVDFLKGVGGVDEDLYSTGVPIEVDGVELRVMNPLFCLESRAYNVIEIASKYDNAHGLKQLRASVLCAREFIREALEAGETRFALDSINRVFKFCCSRVGVAIYVQKSIDAFRAVEPEHAALPDKFRTVRFPQMVTTLSRKRGA